MDLQANKGLRSGMRRCASGESRLGSGVGRCASRTQARG